MNTKGLKVQKRDVLTDSNGNAITKEYFEQIIIKDHFIIFKEGEKYGFLNKDGQRICEAKYRYVECIDDKAVVLDGSKYGIINSKMEELLPLKYELICIQTIDYVWDDNYCDDIYYFDCMYKMWEEHELYTSDLEKVIDDIIVDIYYKDASILACTENKVYAIDARTNGTARTEFNSRLMFPWKIYTMGKNIEAYALCNNDEEYLECIYYDPINQVISCFPELTNMKINPKDCYIEDNKYFKTFIYVRKDKYIDMYYLEIDNYNISIKKVNDLKDVINIYRLKKSFIYVFECEDGMCNVYDLNVPIKIIVCKRKNLEKRIKKYEGHCNLIKIEFKSK